MTVVNASEWYELLNITMNIFDKVSPETLKYWVGVQWDQPLLHWEKLSL